MNGCPKFERLVLKPLSGHVLEVTLNRVSKLNAFDGLMWEEVKACFEWIEREAVDCRVVLLSAAGRLFTAGVDLETFSSVAEEGDDDIARSGLRIFHTGRVWQEAFSVIARCSKVVIACTHNACIGAGLEMISACDIRFCTSDCYFVYKEADVGCKYDCCFVS